MTSRMIKDPMKVYSADNKYRHQIIGNPPNRNVRLILIVRRVCRNSLPFAFLSLSFSLPCRGLGGGVGASPVPLHTSLEQYGINLQKKLYMLKLRAIKTIPSLSIQDQVNVVN